MKITKKSVFSGIERTMDLPITQEQLDEFTAIGRNGRLIQDIFPQLTNSQREFLMTGTTDEEWNEAFPPEDEKE